MDFDMGKRAADLRRELRDLVSEQVPEHFLGAFTDDPADLRDRAAVLPHAGRRRLLSLAWPEEYGGARASVWEQTVVREEMWAHHEPRGAQYMGLNWVGPAIMGLGTDEQKRTHLPPIAAGEVIWCQGFSEPDAGIRPGVAAHHGPSATATAGCINGQKIWTSYATMAQWCFLLARTASATGAARSTRASRSSWCRWTSRASPCGRSAACSARTTSTRCSSTTCASPRPTCSAASTMAGRSAGRLAFERVGIARYARCERLLGCRAAVLGDRWDDLPAELRGRWVRMLTQCRRARLLAYRVVALQSSGRIAPGDAAGLPDRGHQAGPGQRRGADRHRRRGAPHDDRGRVVPRRGGGPLALLPGVDGVLGQHRDAAHPAVPVAAGGKGGNDSGAQRRRQEYGRQARHAFESAGGDQLVARAEAAPEGRESLVGPVLAELGAWELDPRTDTDGLEAAAALCRSAGYWALPYPLAERLAKPADLDVDGLIVVGGARPAVPWPGSSTAGRQSQWTGTAARVAAAGPDGAGIRHRTGLSPIDDAGARDVALGLVLPCWTLLGMLDRALDLTVAHVTLRTQFGQPLSSFQGVQFQLTDAEVERSGLDILAKHALWTTATNDPRPLDDALALRMSAIEAADVVFRVCHQLHGAVGFCDETQLSWLSRYSQPLRRLPFGLSATRDHLTRIAGRRGLAGLYS